MHQVCATQLQFEQQEQQGWEVVVEDLGTGLSAPLRYQTLVAGRKEQAEKDVTVCVCRLSQLDIDGHLARCLSESADDVMW